MVLTQSQKRCPSHRTRDRLRHSRQTRSITVNMEGLSSTCVETSTGAIEQQLSLLLLNHSNSNHSNNNNVHTRTSTTRNNNNNNNNTSNNNGKKTVGIVQVVANKTNTINTNSSSNIFVGTDTSATIRLCDAFVLEWRRTSSYQGLYTDIIIVVTITRNAVYDDHWFKYGDSDTGLFNPKRVRWSSTQLKRLEIWQMSGRELKSIRRVSRNITTFIVHTGDTDDNEGDDE
jgi:hypothetical protein